MNDDKNSMKNEETRNFLMFLFLQQQKLQHCTQCTSK